jgi:hypothetical protein
MHTKDFTDPDLAVEFVKSLQDENTIDIINMPDGSFRVNWIENKKYTSLDGKEFVDEVWTKEDGTMIACQDLDHEHAKNIIRMMLRNERRRTELEEQMRDQLQAALSGILSAGDDEEDSDEDQDDQDEWMTCPPATNKVYH